MTTRASARRQGATVGTIRAASARIFWSGHPESNRVTDVWVSTTDQPYEAYTQEYFSLRWHCVVGNCDADWLCDPDYTPEAVFGEMAQTGFHCSADLINALRPFAKIDSCDWPPRMLGRLEVP